jgi:hypothetical protein
MLGEATFTASWESSRSMNLDEVVTHAARPNEAALIRLVVAVLASSTKEC